MKKLITLSGLLLFAKLAIASNFNLGVASVTISGNYLLKTGDTMTGNLVVPNETVTYGITATTATIPTLQGAVSTTGNLTAPNLTATYGVSAATLTVSGVSNFAGLMTYNQAMLSGGTIYLYDGNSKKKLWRTGGTGNMKVTNGDEVGLTVADGVGHTIFDSGITASSGTFKNGMVQVSTATTATRTMKMGGVVTTLPTSDVEIDTLFIVSTDSILWISTQAVTGAYSYKKVGAQ